MFFQTIIRLLLLASTAHAYWKGFNLGATLPSGACKTQADWAKGSLFLRECVTVG